jgi:hypothetical protein
LKSDPVAQFDERVGWPIFRIALKGDACLLSHPSGHCGDIKRRSHGLP